MIRENLQNIIFQSIAQIIPRAILFVFTFYLASYLGSSEYGKYDFALSFGYLLGAFFELGGNLILTKNVARGFTGLFNYSFKIRISSISVTIFIVLLVLKFTGLYSEIFYHVLFGMFGVALSSLMNLYFAFFRGLKKMNYEAVVLITQKLLFVIICILLLKNSENSFNVVLSFTISMLIAAIVIHFIYIRNKNTESGSFQNSVIPVKEYLKDIGTLALVEIFTIVNMRVSQIILKSYTNFDDVGVYSAAYKIIEAMSNIPAILMIVLFPGFARLAVTNTRDYVNRFKKALLLLSSLGIIASVLCWFGAEHFYSLLGTDYSGAHVLVRIMSAGLLIMFPNFLLSQGLIALDKNLQYAVVVFITLCVNIFSGLMLVPVYGAAGSSFTMIICEVTVASGCIILLSKEFKRRAAEEK